MNEYQWANNNIVRRLLEVFAKYMQGHDHNVRGKCSKMLAWVVDTVGLVARVYPVEPARNNLKSIFDSFAKLLQHESAGLMTPELEVRQIVRRRFEIWVFSTVFPLYSTVVLPFLSQYTPLLSSRAEKKKVLKGWMVPPNSLGQMLNFGTSS